MNSIVKEGTVTASLGSCRMEGIQVDRQRQAIPQHQQVRLHPHPASHS